MKLAYVGLSLPLVACMGGERANTGQCPAGEVCSPKTPNGLHFIGKALVDDVLLSGPAPTAIGGKQDVALQYDRGDGILIALDRPFTADDDGGLGVRVDHASGSLVTVFGAGSRANYLRILDLADGTLFDRKQLTGAALDTIALVETTFERVPDGAQLAWAAGSADVGIALFGKVQGSGGPVATRLVDDSMTITLANASRTAWDSIHVANAAIGTYPIVVHAGDKPPATIDWTVVDHADAMSTITTATTILANGTQEVCFAATTNSRYVVGLTWAYIVDGVTTTKGSGTISRNCVLVSTTKTTGTVSVQASAGSQTKTVTLTVGAMGRELPSAPSHTGNSRLELTAGDRAAM